MFILEMFISHYLHLLPDYLNDGWGEGKTQQDVHSTDHHVEAFIYKQLHYLHHIYYIYMLYSIHLLPFDWRIPPIFASFYTNYVDRRTDILPFNVDKSINQASM